MTEPAQARVLVDGRWLYEHVCADPECNDSQPIRFTSIRRDAQYHATTCRMRAYRRRLAKQKSKQPTGDDQK